MRFKPNNALTLISDNPSWYSALAYDALNLLTNGSWKEKLLSFDATFWFTTCSPRKAPSYFWMEALSWMFSNLKLIFGDFLLYSWRPVQTGRSAVLLLCLAHCKKSRFSGWNLRFIRVLAQNLSTTSTGLNICVPAQEDFWAWCEIIASLVGSNHLRSGYVS